jgi:hypothetical protein
MKTDPNTLFFGNSVDKSIQVELLKEYITHMDDSLADNIKSCNKKHDELSLELQCIAEDKSDLLQNHFPRLLKEGFVISVVIFLENELIGYCQDLQKVEKLGLTYKDLSGSLIERFKKYCEHIAKVDLSMPNETWENIKGILEIRNCLVHNYGSILNFVKATTIQAFSKRHNLPKIEDSFLVIDTETSLKILETVNTFIETIYNAALIKYPKK